MYIRLINANAVMENVKEYPAFSRSFADITDLREILEDTPTVDAVPVIHGKWLWYDGANHCSICDNKGTGILNVEQ